MKKAKKIFTASAVIVLGVFIIFSTSCTKKSNNNNSTTTTTTTGTNPTPMGTLTATWNDTYSGKQGTINETQVTGSVYGGAYYLNAYVTSTNTASVAFQGLSVSGTGTVSLNNGIGVLYESSGSSGDVETGYPSSNPGVGTLTVTAFSTSSGTTTISGTYTFTGGPNPSQGGNTYTVTAPTGTVSGSFTKVPFH